jgi:hypothetical protein
MLFAASFDPYSSSLCFRVFVARRTLVFAVHLSGLSAFLGFFAVGLGLFSAIFAAFAIFALKTIEFE